MRSSSASTRPRPTSRRNAGGYNQTSHHANLRSAFARVSARGLRRDTSAFVLRAVWLGTSGTGQQPVRAGDGDEAMQPLRLRRRDLAACRRQPVVPPPLIVLIRRRTPGRLDDPAVLQHPVQRAVEGARLELQLPLGEAGDFLQQAVAMTL